MKVRELGHWSDFDSLTVEESVTEGGQEDWMNTARPSKMNQGGSTVVANNAEVPQVVQQVGVVRIAKECLRVCSNSVGVKIWEHRRELVRSTYDGHHRLDVSIGESGVQVSCALLVTDLNFEAKASGAELLRRVEHKFPWIGLVVLTSHMSPELAVEDGGGIPAGAVYLVKSQLRGIDVLEDAVERSIAGLPSPPAEPGAETHVITGAQAEVLRMLATGASTKALADHRGTTVRAVETMLARLYAALGLGDDEQSNPRVAAVKMWERGQVSVRSSTD